MGELIYLDDYRKSPSNFSIESESEEVREILTSMEIPLEMQEEIENLIEDLKLHDGEELMVYFVEEEEFKEIFDKPSLRIVEDDE